MAIVLSAVAGGGVSSAASTSGSLTRSGSQTRTTITTVADDTLRATVRLQRLGRYRASVQMTSDVTDCAAHSYGEVHRFFLANPCLRLYRGLVQVQDREHVLLIAIATVEMPDYDTATRLKELFARSGNGDVTQLSRERGRYRYVTFDHASTKLTRRGTSVSVVQAQPVGLTPRTAALDYLISYYMSSLR
ncbi:MAG: hypothetical protein ACRDRG_21570 [Pseudonocardiaceae bacterium]